MDTKQPLSLFLVAILVASVVSVAGLIGMPLQTASAVTTIETSADEHGELFFQGMLQVIIEDDTTDDDSTDSIDVEITVEEDGGSSNTATFPIDDTNDGSQRFELFIVHTDAPDQSPDDPENDVGTDVIDFGVGATDVPVTGFALFDSGSVEIEYDGETVTIDYDESDAILSLDRTVPYGSTSKVRLTIEDNDANLDPTVSNAFTVTDADLDTATVALFEAVGVAFVDDVTFTEEGDNDALFEAVLQLTTADSGTDDELDFTNDAPTLTVNDRAIYTDIDNGNNTSTATSEVSFEIEDDDGTMAAIPSITFGTEIPVSITDDDQNVDSENDDTIVDGLTIEVQGTAGSDTVTVDLAETGDNTGIFVPDLTNDQVRLTFLNDTAAVTAGDDVLQLRPQDIEESLFIVYTDPLSDAGGPDDVASRTIDLNLTPGSITAPDTAGVNDEFTVTLTEPDLNDNALTRDSYVIEMLGASPFALTRGGDTFSEIYQFEMTLAGDDLDFGAVDESVTMTETTANSGIFEFDIDMEAIGDSGDGGTALEISDGDDLDINILDFMADTGDADESEVTITIGKPTVDIDFSRTSVPIPPPTDGETFAEVGESSILTLLLTDPQLANDVNQEETEDFDFGTVANNFTIEVDGEAVVDSEADFFGAAADNCDDGGSPEAEIVDGVSLCTVMGIEDATDLAGVLEETAEDSGLFEWEITFTDTATMDLNDWDDLDIEFTYEDDEGDEHSAGFTFRGSDGSLSVDQPSAKAGTIVTITVEDQDMNLDDAEIEHFDLGDLAGALGAIVLLETEDDEIADLPDVDAFDETGDDTGIFTTSFEVGVDVPISQLVDDEVEQASNILITYEDEIDSTGGAGDEIEISVPIVSSTGSIQISPDLVGPATTMTILVVDSDLDEDADSVDEYNAPAGAETSDDFFISFASDRNEVGEGSPDIEETGANTGVFMFTLELLTDETGCQDDDLDNPDEGDAADFDAEGGDTDATIGACPGDLISIRYEDQSTGGGGSATVSEVVEVSSFDPEFVADQDSYAVGDRVTITISDPDANRDADIADSLADIRVRSDSDQVGEELSALETGEDTGVFRLSFGTTSGTASGSISVRTGDDITITYTDEFPADFEEQEEDKDFDFAVSVGVGNVTGQSTTVTPPAPTDSAGGALDEVNVGQQIVLTTNVINRATESQPFVALVEVRDSADATVYLAWQTGTLNPSGQAQVGLSWTPDFSGDYTARTFVISSLNNPTILSTIAESDIAVS